MAQAERVVLTDDLDGSPAEETITFTVKGEQFEIDLSDKNAAAFWAALGPYIRAARHIPKKRMRRPKHVGSAVWLDPARLRAWAEDHGIPVNKSGYVRKEVQRMYLTAWLKGDLEDKYL
ncbi:Lsr2 family protein [Microbispora sp. NPDC049633]|uniref:histone-like nucleoid-structuring protein Lsr2 n=1 Tax=Microbispora sp. NPDC049633 TaxID=3154355 RepID=UPI0034481732